MGLRPHDTLGRSPYQMWVSFEILKIHAFLAKLVQLEHNMEEKTALRDMAIYVEKLLKSTSG